MAENYKPKKLLAIYDIHAEKLSCPNCHQEMGHTRQSGSYVSWCFNERCRLFDVKYRAVKTLVTMERIA